MRLQDVSAVKKKVTIWGVFAGFAWLAIVGLLVYSAKYIIAVIAFLAIVAAIYWVIPATWKVVIYTTGGKHSLSGRQVAIDKLYEQLLDQLREKHNEA